MNAVERVKEICKERNIALSKLEKDLGFGNAYVSQLKKGFFPDDRLRLIANYLQVSTEYLITGEEKTIEEKYGAELTHIYAKIRNDDALRNALLKYFELPKNKQNHVVELINMLSEVNL